MKKNGLHSLNMNYVAKETKLAKGTLYLYFQSKEEIIAELALKARKLLLNAFIENTDKYECSLEKIASIINTNYLFLTNNRLYYDLVSFYEISERETETAEMQKVIKEIMKLIILIIEDGQRKNQIKNSIDSNILSFSMWGMTVGIMQLIKNKSQVILEHPQLSDQIIIDNYVKVFLDGIKK